jgi:predicted nucleic acid-binding protein
VVIVDTTVWIDYLEGVKNPETEWVHAELDRQRLGLTDLILCEVLQGVRDEVVAKDVERQLLKLAVFEMGGVDLAREAARNYRLLRGRGHTVRKTIDCLIATFCYTGAALVAAPRSRFRSLRDISRALSSPRLTTSSSF